MPAELPTGPTNRPPVARDDGVIRSTTLAPISIEVLANDEDEAIDTLTVVAVAKPTPSGSATVSFDGKRVVFTPDATGTFTFDYTVQDQKGLQSQATVTVAVTETETVSPQALPPAPISPFATAISDSQIDLNWNSGGGTTAGYRISYLAGATPPADCASGTTVSESEITGTAYSFTGLLAGTAYAFRVCALNANPTPDVSKGATATGTTLLSVPPDPTGLLATTISHSQIDLNWDSGGGTTTGYRISYLAGATPPADCASGTTVSESEITGTAYSFTGLLAGTAYAFRVCAINANPTPDVSKGATATGTTLLSVPPDPTGLLATTISHSQIDLNWDSGGGTTTGYRISYLAGATLPADCASGTTVSESEITGTTHSFSGLLAETAYAFRVCALNANPTPDVSKGATATGTTLLSVPFDPTGLLATAVSHSQIDLNWDSGGGTATGYRISYLAGATPPADCASGTTVSESEITGTTHSFSGLLAETAYAFRVCALNANPTPDVSKGATATGTTLLSVPPDPTGLLATAVSGSQIDLNWDSGGGTTTGYRISYLAGATLPADCASGTTVSKSEITGTTHSFSGLLAGTAYAFRVCAINANSTPDVSKGASVMVATLRPFVSVWRTTAPDESITLPLREEFDYDMIVDWGDDTPVSSITSDSDTDKTHTYAVAGDYTVTITGLAEAWYFNNSGDKLKIVSVADLGDMGWLNLGAAFAGCANLTTVLGGNTSSVTDMHSMFWGARVVNPDTTRMGHLFGYRYGSYVLGCRCREPGYERVGYRCGH